MKRCLLFFSLACALLAQTLTQTSTATTATRGTDLRNTSTNPAIAWRLTFWYTGFTAVTMQLDCAPDNGSGAAGTYAACGGAIDGTTNPVTVNSTPQGGTIALKVYSPHVAVNPSSVTGSGTVHWTLTGLFGANTAPTTVTTSGGGGGTQDVNLTEVGGAAITEGQKVMSASVPVVVASDQTAVKTGGSGGGFLSDTQGNSYQQLGCNAQAEVALSGTAYTQIVAGSGTNVIRVCNLAVSSASAGAPVVNTFTVAFGVCASSPTEVMNIAGVTGYVDQFFGTLRGAAGAAFCVKESVANTDKVTVTYQTAVF